MTTPELKLRHTKLKKLDGGSLFKGATYKTFGSETHKFKFNSRLTEKSVTDFENANAIRLPSDYKDFLLNIDNGGSGPYYGLFALNQWDYELEIADKLFLSTPFPYADKWNIQKDFSEDDEDYTETEEFQNWENEYFSTKHITGSIRICHYGCAIYYLLIVTGPEAGTIWIDDRANDNGIYPATSKTQNQRLTFSKWYGDWLTENISFYS